MARQTLSVDDYSFSSEDVFLFDANVWLYLHGPQLGPRDERSQAYSAILKRILDAGGEIFINLLVISEYINRYHKMEFGALPKEGRPPWREYRKGPHCDVIACNVVEDLRRILGFCQLDDAALQSLRLDDLLALHEQGGWEFNDRVLVQLCRVRSFVFVTHDADFAAAEIAVLTANREMIH